MKKIILFGGTGFLGKNLAKRLKDKGYDVALVDRKNKESEYYWDYTNQTRLIEILTIKNVVINLAGSPIIGKRWNKQIKDELIKSRYETNSLIVDTINEFKIENIELYISASGIGYYGDTKQVEVNESSKVGDDFVSEICKKWEEPLNKLSIRKVIFRIGVVLHSSGGAFPRMLTPFKYFIGAALGSGKQYFPWIHLVDLLQLFVFAIENKQVNGIYNAVASEQITNNEFSRALANSINRPLLPNVPSFILNLLLGESAMVLLTGQKASNEKIKKTGFEFRYYNIKTCLKNISNL